MQTRQPTLDAHGVRTYVLDDDRSDTSAFNVDEDDLPDTSTFSVMPRPAATVSPPAGSVRTLRRRSDPLVERLCARTTMGAGSSGVNAVLAAAVGTLTRWLGR